jgi:hypothetical protein
MMSTALVMAVGGEQTKMRSATSDPVESGEMTFAQSFGERTGLAVDAQTTNGAGDASSEMRGGKSSGLSKNADALPVVSAGAKANAPVNLRMTEANENVTGTVANGTGKNVAVGTDFVELANDSGRGRSKTTSVQLPADRDEVQTAIGSKVAAQAGVSEAKTTEVAAATGREKQPVGDVEGSEAPGVVSNGMPAAEATALDSLPRASTALADRSPLPTDEVVPIVQNEIVLAGNTKDVASTKKSSRTQESEIGTKTASKITESVKSVGDASIMTGVQGASVAPEQVAAPSGAQPNATGVTAANVSGAFGATAGKIAAKASIAGTDSTGRKETVRAAKDGIEATGQAEDPAVGTTVVTGSGVEIAKAIAVASTAGKDADEKGLGVVGAAAVVHAATGNEAVASGLVPGMTSGHMPAEINGTKVQAGEGSTHAATSQTGLGEQDGSGVAAAETGMSHRTLLATPMALEVGVTNGTQGWLKIRAEMTDGGVVTASLSSATPAGQEMLHRELPALTAYLQEERVTVNTVVVPADVAAGAESRSAGGMNGEGSGQAQQSGRQGSGDERQASVHGTADRADEVPAYMGLNGVGEDGLHPAGMYAGGGSWLNVRA